MNVGSVSSVLSVCSVLLLLAAPVRAQALDSTLTLHAAVRLALASHPSVAAARAAAAEAGSRVDEAVASRFPQLTTQASLTQFELPMIVAPLHRFDPTKPPTFDRTLVQGSGQLGYVLFDGGARGARIGAARAEGGAAQAGITATTMQLTAQVVRSYLGVLSAAGQLDAQQQSLVALEAEQDRVVRALEVGRAARVELLRVQAAAAQAEAERVATAADLGVAVRSLARLLSVNVQHVTATHLAPVRLRDSAVTQDRPALLRRAAAASPELETVRERQTAADQGRRVARAAWFPRLELGGAYLGFGSGDGNFTSEWQGQLRFSYPVFQGGARRAQIAAASARADVAAERYRLAQLELEGAVDQAVAAVEETGARVRAMTRAVQHLSEVVRIEQLSLEAGAGTQTDFLRADADLRRSRAVLIDARHSEIMARVELARITGELSPDRLAALVESVR